MSKTIIDMPKVSQMLDSGWCVQMFKNSMNSYTVRASHPRESVRRKTEKKLREFFAEKCVVAGLEYCRDQDWEGDELETDDFTPEQALTRMAYKVFGEILL